MGRKKYRPFKAKILSAAVIANAATMALVLALPHILPEPQGSRALRETAAAIDRAVNGEKAVTVAVIEVSRLAGGSGYDLAVREAIRDHGANVSFLKKSAAILSGIGNPYENNLFIAAVISLLATQACCLFAFLLATVSDAEDEAYGMSRRIDELAAVKNRTAAKPAGEKPLSMVRINGMLKN